MSPIEYYAITVAGILLACICGQWSRWCQLRLYTVRTWLRKCLCHRRSIFNIPQLGSWTWLTVGIQLLLLGTNLLLMLFRSTDVRQVARRAGELAVTHLAVFCLGAHLSFQADCLHMRLTNMHVLHRCLSGCLALTIAWHAIVLRPREAVFTAGLSHQLYGIIVG